MASPWAGFPSSRGRDSFSSRQSLNYSSFLDTSMSSTTTRSTNRSALGGKVIENTPNHTVKEFGHTLPVQIKEALSSKARHAAQHATVGMEQRGWAWLVCGRRLFVWRYLPVAGTKSLYCKELVLPATDLKHSADLVTLLPSALGGEGNSAASVAVMAASPEGLVRYWPSLGQDASTVEITADLAGKQCHSLTAFLPHGCILSTTTNDMMFLIPSQKTITTHVLSSSSGMLSNIGRRMTSLFFGAAQPPESAQSNALQRVLIGNAVTSSSRAVYALSGNQLSKWDIRTSASAIQEKLLFRCDCENMFIAAAEQSLQTPLEKVDQMRVWCLDICNFSSDVLVLAAVALKGPSRTSLFYLLGTVSGGEVEEPTSLASVSVVQFVEEYDESHLQDLLGYQLVVPDQSSTIFVYSSHSVIIVPAFHADDVINKIDFRRPIDEILGAAAFEEKALFFSRRHGIINIISKDDENLSLMVEVTDSKPDVTQSTLPNISVSEDFKAGESADPLTQFKKAFVLFCQRKCNDAQEIINDLFASDDHALDTAVTKLSQEVIDDFPASDPRWAESIPAGKMSTSASLIILNQLEDKLKVHGFLLDFFKGVGLWEKLKTVVVRDKNLPTWCLLCEHAEKIVAAIALCNCLKRFQTTTSAVISKAVKRRGTKAPFKTLTDNDIFFREVSNISDIFECLWEHEESNLQSSTAAEPKLNLVVTVNTIMQEMLQSAWQYRQDNSAKYEATGSAAEHNMELMFWTATTGPSGIRTILIKQLRITERMMENTDDQQVQALMCDQMVALVDIVLDGYVCQLESLRHCDKSGDRYDEVEQKFEQDRYNLILPLAKLGHHKYASSLAEKYREFGVLIELCESRGDQDTLQQYTVQFKDMGFSDYLFKWYMDKGERHRLLSQPAPQHDNLAKFLSSHHHLSWLHDLHTKNFFKAHETLRNLADKESALLSRKKTLLSLSKLALLASDEDEVVNKIDEEAEINSINNEHAIIFHQESLPLEVIQHSNLSFDSMPPIPCEELIQLYIGDKNRNSDEQDFKKALDLLQLMGEAEIDQKEHLKLMIWCKAILRDNWSSFHGSNPLDSARQAVFFKTVQLAYSQGLHLSEFMPTIESLLASEELRSAGLSDNPHFRYLLSTGYEQIQRSSMDESEAME